MMMSACLISLSAHSGVRPSEHRLVTPRPSIEATRTLKRGLQSLTMKPVPQQAGGVKDFDRRDRRRCIAGF